MSGEGYCQSGVLSSIVAKLREARIEGRLTTSESDTEATVHVELRKPTGYMFDIQHSRILRRITIRARQITRICEGHRHISRRNRP